MELYAQGADIDTTGADLFEKQTPLMKGLK
jgi:hypothetical protein